LLWSASDDVGLRNFLPVALVGILLLVVVAGGPLWLAKMLGVRGTALVGFGFVFGCSIAIVVTIGSVNAVLGYALAPAALTLSAMFAAGRLDSRPAAAVVAVTAVLYVVMVITDADSDIRNFLFAGLVAWVIVPAIGALRQSEEAQGEATPAHPTTPSVAPSTTVSIVVQHLQSWRTAHRRTFRAGIVALAIVAGTVSCAGVLSRIQNAELSASIHVTGPLYGYVEGNGSVAGFPSPGGGIVGTTGYEDDVLVFAPDARFPSATHTFHYDHGGYTAHLRVTDPGPAFIAVNSVNESGGGLFGGDDEVKGRAIFVVSAPVNAQLRLKGDTARSVGKLRLEVDRDGDGTFDETLKPDFVKTGDDIDDYGQFKTTATVDSNGTTDARVSLTTQGKDRVDRTYIWSFPANPLPQLYDAPIELTDPSYLLFASIDVDGNLERVQEARILGGAPVIEDSIDLDTERTISFREPGQVARLTFEGHRDQRIVARVTASDLGALPCCTGRMQVLGPDDTALASETGIGANPSAMETVVLDRDGVYTLIVNPYLAYTGDVTVVLETLDDATARLRPNGQPMTLSFEHVAQQGLVTFYGAAGQQVSVVIKIVEGFCCSADAELLAPDGTPIANGRLTLGDDVLTMRALLAVDGVYTVALAPNLQKPGELTVELNSIEVVETTVSLDAPATEVEIGTPGQSAQLRFDGSAGQQLYVTAHDSIATDNGLGTAFGDFRTRLSVRSEDSTDEIVRAWLVPRDDSVVAVTLPGSGRYVIEIDPPTDATGTATIGLSSTLPERATLTAAALPVNHPAETLSIDDPKSLVQRSFTAVEGQLVTVAIQDVVGEELDHCCSYWPHLFDPHGNEISYDIETRLNLFGTDGVNEALRFPETGVYVLEVQSYETATGQFSLAFSSSDDLKDEIAIGDSPATIMTSQPGQTARVTFTGQAGDVFVNVAMAEQGRTTDDGVTYTIPDAERWFDHESVTITPGLRSHTRFTLPQDGMYTIVFQPTAQTTFAISLSITLTEDESTPVPEIVPQPITVDGDPIDVSLADGSTGLTRAALDFSGKQGERLTIDIEVAENLHEDACCGYHVVVVGPSTPALVAERDLTKGRTRLEVTLPSTGDYRIWLRTVGNSSGTLRVSVTSID
ncbi:MAG TPA: hypothetical protein VFV93_08225, partial [Thermomicrobiales bacterium]|nr:hypothetical protein [Thermomicrobiales bacterium]